MNNPIRWKQRFSNFEKAYIKLAELMEISSLSEFEKIALTKIFELTFELSWKTLKDYLEEEGFDVKTPRATIKQAFAADLITNEDVWIDVLMKRNTIAHNYNVTVMEETVTYIRNQFFPLVRDFYHAMKQENK